MGTGLSRLLDKHTRKSEQTARAFAIVNQMDNELKERKTAPTKKAVKADFGDLTGLTSVERDFFTQIWGWMAEIHEDPEPFRLAAINLAKTCAMGKRLEAQIEKDGGMVLENSKGGLYMHPAVKVLQSNNSQVLAYCRSLGLALNGGTSKKKEKEEEFVSEFAQFQ